MNHYIIRIGVPRVPEIHWGIGRGVIATVPRDGIAKRATDAWALATATRATKHTTPASGAHAKPHNAFGLAPYTARPQLHCTLYR